MGKERKKSFLECMLADLNNIREGTDEEVKKELIEMDVDLKKAEQSFLNTLAQCLLIKEKQKLVKDQRIKRQEKELPEDIIIGKTYILKYPFVIADYLFEDNESWVPGAKEVPATYEFEDGSGKTWAIASTRKFHSVAHGVGERHLTVIGFYRPGEYPARVFYTQKWKDPEGKVFGRSKLRMSTLGNFRKILKGYRYKYEIQK